MEYLYGLIGFIPNTLQPGAMAFLLIVVGYFFSLLFSVIVVSPFPKGTHDNARAPFRGRLYRICFWVPLLAFTLVGFNQLPLLSAALNKLRVSATHSTTLLVMCMGAVVLLLCEDIFVQIGKKISGVISPLSKIKIPKSLVWVIFIVFVGVCGFELDTPNSFTLKVTASSLLIVFGFVLGGIVKAAISSLLDIVNSRVQIIPRALHYFVVSAFLLTAIELWT